MSKATKLTQRQLRIVKRWQNCEWVQKNSLDDNGSYEFVYQGKNKRRKNAFIGHTEQDGYDYVMLIVRRMIEESVYLAGAVEQPRTYWDVNEQLRSWCESMRTIFKNAENTFDTIKFEQHEI